MIRWLSCPRAEVNEISMSTLPAHPMLHVSRSLSAYLGASGRAPPEVANGQGAAKAGEHQAATASAALRGGPNRALFEDGDCLTLIETNHNQRYIQQSLSMCADPES